MPQVRLPTEKNESERTPNFQVKDIYYNMNHSRRGMALILNHEHFSDSRVSQRRGTKKDRDLLDLLLTNLGFSVQIQNDLTYEGIFNCIKNLAKMNHSKYDCLLIAVLTHGDLGMLYAKDMPYSLTKLWCYFTDEHCPTLAGKPKIYFIQACRGERYDDGVTLTNVTDGPTEISQNPVHPDFVFAFSSAIGFYSFRNTQNGSSFIKALCKILSDDQSSNQNILNLLTKVCLDVAVNFESFTDDKENNEKKQMPCIYSTLTRLLVFGKNNKNEKKENVECCTAV